MNERIEELAMELRMELRKAGLSPDVRVVIETTQPRDWQFIATDHYLLAPLRYAAWSPEDRREGVLHAQFATFRLVKP